MTKNKENEGETAEDKKHWKDADVEVMIALRREMEPEFLKIAKKQGMLNLFVELNFSTKNKRSYFRLGQLGLLKALASCPRNPLSPH